MNKTIWILVILNGLFGVGHHIDHIFRHNVGWPIIHEVNGFTGTLLIYAVMGVGAVLTVRGVVGPGFWAIVSVLGGVYVFGVHFASFAPDPVSQYAAQYGSRVKGNLAIAWVWLFIATSLGTAVYCAKRWWMLRRPLAPRTAH